MEELKGLILSGGAGTRLRPITHTSAKQLVPVANKPVLFYGIEALVEAGITEIAIIIAPETGEEIRRRPVTAPPFGASITYIEQEAPPGLPTRCSRRRTTSARALRHVPGRHPPRRDRGAGGRSSAAQSPTRRSCSPRSRTLLHTASPNSTGIGSSAWSRSRRTSPSDPALVGVYMFGPRSSRPRMPSSPPPAANWRSRTRSTGDRVRPQGRVAHRQGLVEGHREARGHARRHGRLVLEDIEQRIDGDLDDASQVDGRW